MKIVTVSAATIPARAHYIRHVLENGHEAGVLSGAELTGKAKTYGARYAQSRRRAEAIAKAHGIRSDILERRRVWVDESGAPVRILLED